MFTSTSQLAAGTGNTAPAPPTDPRNRVRLRTAPAVHRHLAARGRRARRPPHAQLRRCRESRRARRAAAGGPSRGARNPLTSVLRASHRAPLRRYVLTAPTFRLRSSDVVRTLKQIHLVRNRDAGTLHAEGGREHDEVVGTRRDQRQIDGVGAGGAKRRVVHRGRDGVRQRRSDHAVDVGAIGHLTESELVEHARGRESVRARAPHRRTTSRSENAQPAPASGRPPAPCRSARCFRRARAAAGCRLSDNERAVTATLTISAPVARIDRTRSTRSSGTPSKSCVDTTIRFPPVEAIRSRANGALNSTSTYSAPELERAVEDRPPLDSPIRRSLHPPISHGRSRSPARGGPPARRRHPDLRPNRAAARRDRRPSAASRRRRSSAVVGAATVTTRSGLDIKKASSTGLAEEALLAPESIGLRPRQSPLQSGRNTTIQNQTTRFPTRRRQGAGNVWSWELASFGRLDEAGRYQEAFENVKRCATIPERISQ